MIVMVKKCIITYYIYIWGCFAIDEHPFEMLCYDFIIFIERRINITIFVFGLLMSEQLVMGLAIEIEILN